MSSPLIEGLGTGLVLSCMVGPVFFALIQNSMVHGVRTSIYMALGVLASDASYVLLSLHTVNWMSSHSDFPAYLGLFGGLVLVAFGLSSFFVKNNPVPDVERLAKEEMTRKDAFLKGLSLNGINPFVALFWISVAGIVTIKGYTPSDKWLYYTGVLATVFSTDLVKIYVAKAIGNVVTPAFVTKVNRLVGLLFVLFGSRLFYFAFERLDH